MGLWDDLMNDPEILKALQDATRKAMQSWMDEIAHDLIHGQPEGEPIGFASRAWGGGWYKFSGLYNSELQDGHYPVNFNDPVEVENGRTIILGEYSRWTNRDAPPVKLYNTVAFGGEPDIRNVIRPN